MVVLRRAADFLLADVFLLAIVFPFLVVVLRLVFDRLLAFFFAGLLGFSMTTSANGMSTGFAEGGSPYIPPMS